jgi:hypothetical protein
MMNQSPSQISPRQRAAFGLVVAAVNLWMSANVTEQGGFGYMAVGPLPAWAFVAMAIAGFTASALERSAIAGPATVHQGVRLPYLLHIAGPFLIDFLWFPVTTFVCYLVGAFCVAVPSAMVEIGKRRYEVRH